MQVGITRFLSSGVLRVTRNNKAAETVSMGDASLAIAITLCLFALAKALNAPMQQPYTGQ
jgi:hypothetical protein